MDSLFHLLLPGSIYITPERRRTYANNHGKHRSSIKVFTRLPRQPLWPAAGHLWPSPAILRRWLRRPAFRAALKSVRDALRFQSDFHLAAASARAARALAASCAQDSPLSPQDAYKLLHLHHIRQRFADERTLPPLPIGPAVSDILEYLESFGSGRPLEWGVQQADRHFNLDPDTHKPLPLPRPRGHDYDDDEDQDEFEDEAEEA